MRKTVQFSNPFPYTSCYIFAVKMSSCLQYLISQHCSFVYHFCIQSTKGEIIAWPFYVEIKSWMCFRKKKKKKGVTRQCGVENWSHEITFYFQIWICLLMKSLIVSDKCHILTLSNLEHTGLCFQLLISFPPLCLLSRSLCYASQQ